MSSLWSDSIRNLQPYQPGEQPQIAGVIKLNTNENPYPPSPIVLQALQEAVNSDLRLYPDPEGAGLKQAIAGHYDVTSANVFLGNSSDEVLAHTFMALLKHEQPLLFPDITYSFYPVYCQLYGIDFETIPLDDEFQINVVDYMKPNGGVVIANPNAPTGIGIDLDTIRLLLEHCSDSVVVVDEAYVDFGAESAVALIKEFPNLLVIQTLSKSRSLAGLRVGFAIGDAHLIAALNVVKGSFNSYPLDRLALAGAKAAIQDVDYFETSRQRIIKNREWLSNELRALQFEVLPSQANFVFVRHLSRKASDIQSQLRQRHIVVRHFSQLRINHFLRISIGTFEECTVLINALQGILADNQPANGYECYC